MSEIELDVRNKFLSARVMFSVSLWSCDFLLSFSSRQVWRMFCGGFRHSAGCHARVILDGAACRPRELGDVHDVLGVLGVDHVVPVVLRVLVSW